MITMGKKCLQEQLQVVWSLNSSEKQPPQQSRVQ